VSRGARREATQETVGVYLITFQQMSKSLLFFLSSAGIRFHTNFAERLKAHGQRHIHGSRRCECRLHCQPSSVR